MAQLRRRSRDVLEQPDPGPVLRSSLEHGGGGGTEECRRAARLVGRSKRAVGQQIDRRQSVSQSEATIKCWKATEPWIENLKLARFQPGWQQRVHALGGVWLAALQDY